MYTSTATALPRMPTTVADGMDASTAASCGAAHVAAATRVAVRGGASGPTTPATPSGIAVGDTIPGGCDGEGAAGRRDRSGAGSSSLVAARINRVPVMSRRIRVGLSACGLISASGLVGACDRDGGGDTAAFCNRWSRTRRRCSTPWPCRPGRASRTSSACGRTWARTPRWPSRPTGTRTCSASRRRSTPTSRRHWPAPTPRSNRASPSPAGSPTTAMSRFRSRPSSPRKWPPSRGVRASVPTAAARHFRLSSRPTDPDGGISGSRRGARSPCRRGRTRWPPRPRTTCRGRCRARSPRPCVPSAGRSARPCASW